MSFYTTFEGTLEYARKQLDLGHEGARARRPVVLAAPATPAPAIASLAADPVGTCSVSLRSVRAPKFTVEYTVPRADSVYSLKERLLTDPTGPLKDEKLTPAAVKLLVKAKVVPDARQLAELPSTEFTVMVVKDDEAGLPYPAPIYWGDEAALVNAAAAEPAAEPPAEPAAGPAAQAGAAAPRLPGLSEQFWAEIEAVAKRYVEDPHSLLQKFREATAAPRAADEIDLD